MDDEKGTKRNENDWMDFAMNLRKRAKQGPEEDESEMNAVDVVNWINAVLEEGRPEEEEEAWACVKKAAEEMEADDDETNDDDFEFDGNLDEEEPEDELDPEKMREAREEECKELERRVFLKVPVEECWEKTGKAPIGVRWVDVRKNDDTHRSRLVARDFRPKSRVDDLEGLFASMPPLELVKLLVVMAAEECRKGKLEKAMFIDIGKAHLHAPVEGEVYVELPPERFDEGMCAKLLFELYGKRTAANSWEREYTKTLIEALFSAGRANKCTFYHEGKGVRIVVHGDDFVVTGPPAGLEFVKKILSKKYPVKVRAVLGPEAGDDKEATILNRIVRWEDGEISFEADPKHVKRMLKDMRLQECNSVLTPGTKEARKQEDKKLTGGKKRMFRSMALGPITSHKIGRTSGTPRRSCADTCRSRWRATGWTSSVYAGTSKVAVGWSYTD
jgi:hypothetical protein